ncbi:MAG: DedA family protein [Candidatus Magasanikbacteria bacterium]|nr:DedA family protein [Candidatus Magasanikbacteria bacterium]
MSFFQFALDFFLHIDRNLQQFIALYGATTYAILFVIIFCETGLVATPFLPGDSLLFAAGAFAATTALDAWPLIAILSLAAILGDTFNYWIGYHLGPKVFQKDGGFFFRKEQLLRAEKFYETHGGKTIIIARFMPIIRTFAPFVAGIGRMDYKRFLLFNITGGAAWVGSFTLLGYFFGNLPAVKERFSLVIVAIVIISLLPAALRFLRPLARRHSCAAQTGELDKNK